MALRPYQPRTFSPEDAAHLARRTSFGATPSELRDLQALGPRRAVERLMTFDARELPGNPFDPSEAVQGGGAVKLSQARWLHELLYSPHPLREKLTLFWSNHFVVGTDKVRHGLALTQYLTTLRSHGLGKFERLTLEVSRTPAMLRYLDNDQNKKGKPNENFARELLELFTTGIGHYTEDDVREGARAFTGWTFRGGRNQQQDVMPEFVFAARQHDDGPKTYLGRRGNLTGEQVIAISVAHPATPEFVCRKIWRAFVSDTPDGSGVRDLVDVWRATGGDLREVFTALLTSETFYDARHRSAIVKSPVEYVVGTLRAAGRPALDGEKQYLSLIQSMARMGQELLHPPTVEGWKGGREWVNDTALLTRLQVAAALTIGKNAKVTLPEGDLPLALLGRTQNPFQAALRGLMPPQQAYLMLISPEYALA